MADLNTALKQRLNISEVSYAAPAAAAAAPVAAAAVEEPAEEEPEPEVKKVQTEFSLIMTGYDEKSKIKGKIWKKNFQKIIYIFFVVIKAIKANMPDMNLVASKKFIEALPKSLRKDVSKEEAEKVKAALEAEGAIVEMK